MATWAGYSTEANTAFFSILQGKPGQSAPIWITLIVSVFAISMNESGMIILAIHIYICSGNSNP
jgi:hypothetical protein